MQIRNGARFLILATVAIIPLFLYGCSLFKPREPRPGGGSGVSCATPNTPEAVLSNVVQHYGELAGVTCYTQMLDTGFAFHPDAADSIQALPDTIYANWNRDIEARVAGGLASDATFHVAAFDSEYAPRVISSDQRTQTRFYTYHLIIHASQVPDTLFKGLADITFFQGLDAQWHITNWADKRDASGAPTWGFLRGRYRTGF